VNGFRSRLPERAYPPCWQPLRFFALLTPSSVTPYEVVTSGPNMRPFLLFVTCWLFSGSEGAAEPMSDSFKIMSASPSPLSR
jgi:hypothetical protein